MKIIAIDKVLPGVTVKDMQPHFKTEAKKAWELYAEGILRELYFRQDHPGAVLTLECESVEAAKTILDDLPLVKAGLIEFECIPVGPFTPFAALFAQGEE